MMNFIGFSMLFAMTAALGLISLGIWIWAIVDCLKSRRSNSEKIVWLLVILLLNVLGAIIYLVLKGSTVKGEGQLRRSSSNRVIAGVCGGMAEHFKVDATVIRLLWVLLTLFSIGTGLLLYLIAAMIMPEDEKGKKKVHKQANTGKIVVVAVAAVLIVLILSVLLIALVALNAYDGGVSVSKNVQVVDERDIARKIAYKEIMASEGYQAMNASDLIIKSFEAIDDDTCWKGQDDPYGLRINEPECYRMTFMYTTLDRDMQVEAIMADHEIKKIKYMESKREIRNTKDCTDAGFELVYPELEGGPVKCLTDEGLVDVATVSHCKDVCGDGVCQEMVCMGEGCPCAEDAEKCPSDCS